MNAQLQRADVHDLAGSVIGHHSKSFALASKLLPPEARLDAQVLYAYCRHADDEIDEAPVAEQPARLAALRAELDAIYGGHALSDPLRDAFQRVAMERGIPRAYVEELIAGMEMDVLGTRYDSFETLLRYCYRVAGTVGLMMCHVMGVRDREALPHAAHLGIAMQLTNIARDVQEDWQRGRLYLPDDLLAEAGLSGLRDQLGGPFPTSEAPALARVIAVLLQRADHYYASGDAGLPMLSGRCGFGVRTARLVYSEIGRVLQARGCDPTSGRAVVSRPRKLWLALRAGMATLASLPRLLRYPRPRVPSGHIEDAQSVLWLAGDSRG